MTSRAAGSFFSIFQNHSRIPPSQSMKLVSRDRILHYSLLMTEQHSTGEHDASFMREVGEGAQWKRFRMENSSNPSGIGGARRGN
jgi:hypothetical protein